MKPYKWIVLLVCAAFLLAACTTTSQAEIPVTGPTPAAEVALPPDVLVKIQDQVSTLLGVPVESIQIQQVEKRDWPDECLGLPESGEECAQALTAGWYLVFNVNGQEHRFRTNEDGTILRLEP